ncbi:gamma-glutamylcyclotransferase family protein [Thalassotalea marina]|uniref:Gamma-glutamylcyclotransferase n=1 Tax=Thalassotalea marina TaxID=1673741 RepID=A0A919BQU3_9GAMM|nr:gamma-glutamylcyclotransferase family protein [Thalassotalea marina]GHG05976.1 hypothetical protein GCM10017161_39470 [Thalassotalea marina]
MTQSHFYYFAYGSNMSVKRILHRLPNAKLIGPASLAEYDLRFHKTGDDDSAKCDAYFTGETHSIFGVLYQLHQDEKQVLDQIEGVGKGYNVKTVNVTTATQEMLSAFLYVATEIDETKKPYDWYHNHVLTGALEHQLPHHYIEEKIRSVKSKPDKNATREHIETNIYRS